MNRFAIRFSKKGYIKYTSHLDILRLFKRAFKKTGVDLDYSQGFNPHPKMGFAQPLSLGYSSNYEIIEFETKREILAEEIVERMKKAMPAGIEIMSCVKLDDNIKSLASMAEEAEYLIEFPVKMGKMDYGKLVEAYLAQDSIIAKKRQKKTKKMVDTEIRPKIRNIEVLPAGERLILKACLDCGSASNLSPEAVISSFCEFAEFDCLREEIEVERVKIKFVNNLQF